MFVAPGLFQPANAQGPVLPKDVLKDSVTVYFKPSSSKLDLSWKDNAVSLENFFSRVDAALEGTDAQLVKVQIWPGASPEGPVALNERLAKERTASILACLRQRMAISDSACESEVRIVDWDRFRSLVVADRSMPKALKDQTLKILDQQPWQGDFKSRVGQQAWDYVHDHFFPALRSATTVLSWKVTEEPLPAPQPQPQKPEEPEPQPQRQPEPEPEQPLVVVPPVVPYSVENYTTRDFLLKLNVLTLPALVLNGGVEFQVADHFSLGLTAFYSGLDWFDETRKFRTLAFQPEARYWFRNDLHGLFLGLHGTLGWYNVAWGGEYRYQDNRPSLGGGLDVGYKFRLGKDSNSPWGLELGLGAGVLPLHYDMFYNVNNGRLADKGNYTWWGIDQAFVAFTYRFGQTKHPKK